METTPPSASEYEPTDTWNRERRKEELSAFVLGRMEQLGLDEDELA